MSIVLDASVTIAWLFTDERSEAATGVLRRVVETGALVPSLWRVEVANVLRNAARRGRCDEEYVDRSLERLGRLSITGGPEPAGARDVRQRADNGGEKGGCRVGRDRDVMSSEVSP